MIFIETSNFTKLLPSYLSDEKYRALQAFLLQRPEAGDIVRGSGGVRKVRWAPEGQGKSGGVRHLLLEATRSRNMDADDIFKIGAVHDTRARPEANSGGNR